MGVGVGVFPRLVLRLDITMEWSDEIAPSVAGFPRNRQKLVCLGSHGSVGWAEFLGGVENLLYQLSCKASNIFSFGLGWVGKSGIVPN